MRTTFTKLMIGLGTTLVVGVAVLACNQGGEGDRCNPYLSHDECGGDTLFCSGPGTNYPLPGNCVENYCCPKDPTKSSNPDCNGTDTACPAPADAGPAGSDAADGG